MRSCKCILTSSSRELVSEHFLPPSLLHSGSVNLQLSRETSLRCSVPFPSLLPPLTSCLFQSVKEINQLSVGRARTCKAWKAHSAEPEHCWGGRWRRLDWTGRSSLSPTAASRTSRELCVEGEDWESLAWLRASALLCLLIHCTFLEALAAACPSWQASCRESGHGHGTAVSRACPKASVSPPN